MKRYGLVLRTSAMLGAALLLGACGSMHERHALGPKGSFTPNALQVDLLRQDRNRNGVPEQLEKVQQIKVCSTALCVSDVEPLSTTPPAPGDKLDCQIVLRGDQGKSADIVLLLGTGAKALTWNLKQPAASQLDYRFTPAPSAGSSSPFFGIYLYADAKKSVFSLGQVTPEKFVLDRGPRVTNEGFAFGVYLDWKLKSMPNEPSSWQSCQPLDPIIIEHN